MRSICAASIARLVSGPSPARPCECFFVPLKHTSQLLKPHFIALWEPFQDHLKRGLNIETDWKIYLSFVEYFL